MSLHPRTRSMRLGYLHTDSPQLAAPSREVEFANATRRMTLIATARRKSRVKDSKRVRKEEDERTASILAAMDSGKPEAEAELENAVSEAQSRIQKGNPLPSDPLLLSAYFRAVAVRDHRSNVGNARTASARRSQSLRGDLLRVTWLRPSLLLLQLRLRQRLFGVP